MTTEFDQADACQLSLESYYSLEWKAFSDSKECSVKQMSAPRLPLFP
jgi:hypothetical protein